MIGQVFLKKERDASIHRGHPWLFSGAIASVIGNPPPGAVVQILTFNKKVIAQGFYNPHSEIAVRIICRVPEAAIDRAFWEARFRSAVALRNAIRPPQTNAMRIINAEGDGFPGLVVDQYADHVVCSMSTMGVELLRDQLLEMIMAILQPKAILERSTGSARRREGLTERTDLPYGAELPDKVEIEEHGHRFLVDLRHGQKTGFFLDQRENRRLVASLSQGLEVLNCFSYTGGFSVYCARAGAKRVTSVESSKPANEMAAFNLALNGFDVNQHVLYEQDVLKFLRSDDSRYDMVILDPPAFAKTQKDVSRAARGYKEINLGAIEKLTPNGYLAAFSCSNHVSPDLFKKIVLGAVNDAGKSAQILYHLGPGADHPTDLAHDEGRYLKGLLLRIVEA